MEIRNLLATFLARGAFMSVLESASLIAEVLDQIEQLYSHAQDELDKINKLLRVRGFGYPAGAAGVEHALDMQTQRWREAEETVNQMRRILGLDFHEDPIPVLAARLHVASAA